MADFVLLPCKLISAFVEDVADYIKKDVDSNAGSD